MKNNLSKSLESYYSKRAEEYESIYNRPDQTRIKEQKFIAEYIRKSFKKRFVLELACGTGYWTKYLLKSENKIVAIDVSKEMLEIASNRFFNNPSIVFLQGDAYNPPVSFPPYNGVMANFWFSHIPKKKIKKFLSTLHSRCAPNSFILFVDNVYYQGLGGDLIVKTESKDTWKRRFLQSGKKYEILKNYYKKKEVEEIFSPYSRSLEIHYLKHFWLVGYFLKSKESL